MSAQSTGLEPLHLLHILQELWTKKEIHELPEEARRGFASLSDPLEGLLVMLENSHDWRKGKAHSLAHYIIEQFSNWITEDVRVQQPFMKQPMLQARVSSLLTEVPTNMLDRLISLYEVHKADTSSQLGLINELCVKGKYKEAVLLSIKLKLQPKLDMEEMCIPLLLQDKVNLVEAYIADYPELQHCLLQLLDSWCHPRMNAAKIQRRYGKLSHLRWNKLNCKALSKLVFRLMELYDVDPVYCPNVVNQRSLASIKYLLYKRFLEKSMSEENWSEHIEAVLGENPQLQGQFLNLLARYTDVDTVAIWALRLNVPQDKLSYHVAARLNALENVKLICLESSCTEKSREERETRRKLYYQLPIPIESVHFLDHLDQLRNSATRVLQAGSVVGIDMEWRPTFGVLTNTRVSILQIAMKDCVYLLDLPQLVKQSESECRQAELTHFIQTLFTDHTITKLGYATAGDLRTLSTAYPVIKDMQQFTAGVLDLLNVHKELQRVSVRRQDKRRGVDVLESGEDDANSGNRQREKGLSLLVQYVLGKPLDKTEQLSNWEKRPLRLQQIIYAAADAYCLLDVYDALQREPQRFGLSGSFEEFLTMKMKSGREKKSKRNKSSPSIPVQCVQTVQPTPRKISSFPPISPSEFSVVCDNMLQGLGRYLRCLGVDVKILDNEDDHRKAAEIAREENRFILTCGLPYQTLRSQVGEDRCLSLNCSEKAKDQAVTVLKHFNVQVSPKDIFSRCQVCNGAEYLKLSVEEMVQVVQLNAGSETTECSDQPAATRRLSSTKLPKMSLQRDTGSCLGHTIAYNPSCHWAEGSELNMKTLRFTSGARLQVEAIPPGILDKVDMFYCCTSCGKVFWEGSHFSRVLSQFQEVLHITDDMTFYHSSSQCYT